MTRFSDKTATGPETVEGVVTKYRKMVIAGRVLAPMAAENLDYWLSGRGGIGIIPARHFQNDAAILSHLRTVHRSVF